MCKQIPTPHIAATSIEDFASTVLMPGDPLRAKFIAQTYLNKPRLVSDVRGILAYTGEYNGKKISVMASGMGMPSIGIYSYELFNFYQVKRIVRLGSCGALRTELKLGQVLLGEEAWTESTFAKVQSGYNGDILQASPNLCQLINGFAQRNNYALSSVRMHCSDVFYAKNFRDFEKVRDLHDCDVVEMESFALFANARCCEKEAVTILTVSDSLVTGEKLPTEARRSGFVQMIELALEAVTKN